MITYISLHFSCENSHKTLLIYNFFHNLFARVCIDKCEEELLNANMKCFHWLEFLSLCLVIAAWWTGIESHLAYEGTVYYFHTSSRCTVERSI